MPGRSATACSAFGPGLAAALGLAVLLSGCATLSLPPTPLPSFAIAHPEGTRLGRALAASRQEHPGQSGFLLLDYGLEALVARAAVAGAADQTIDAQYYIYDFDTAGSILTERLLSAADRGVRVRLLLDDFNLNNDRELLGLCAHPGVQVRIFNPVSRGLRWARFVEYALHYRRADRRMHNKLFIVDNEVAILGGRNIGDDYFNVEATSAFRDFDVLAAGPIAARASSAFDKFWNSPWAVPAPTLIGRRPAAADLAWLRRRLHERAQTAARFETDYAGTRDRYLAALEHDGGTLTWAPADMVSDAPNKITGDGPGLPPLVQRLDAEWRRSRQEVLIEAAYFVPKPSDIAHFAELHARGIAVRIMTSGADATDVPIVYCAYRADRPRLLAAGVDLHEFRARPRADRTKREWYRRRPPYAALHSKVIVFDRKIAWIGSFNLDPRSARLNTEIAVIIRSEVLAQQLARLITDDFAPDRSWHVQWAHPPQAGSAGSGPITWTGEMNGRLVTLTHEPGGFGRHLQDWLLSLVPGLGNEL